MPVVPSGPPRGEPQRGPKFIPVQVKRERMRQMTNLLSLGMTRTDAVDAATTQYGLSRTQAEKLYSKVLRSWRADDEAERAHAKEIQLARLRRHITRAALRNNWSAVAALEDKIARIQGNYAPIEHRVVDEIATVREATLHVIASMTFEEIEREIEQQRELEVLADRGRGLALPVHVNGKANGTA